MENSIKLSVHQLVDFLLRSGDIDNRIFNKTTMQEGTLLHALYQSKQGPNYISEHPLSYTFFVNGFNVTLEGRADGIIVNGSDYIVDEIKTTIADLNEFKDTNLNWHLGQAKCYAYMFAKEKNLEHIGVRLTYIKQGDMKNKLYANYEFIVNKLEQDILDLIDEYLEFYNLIEDLKKKRNESIETLTFPFSNYRAGQKELAKYTYAISRQGGRLFVEAPTGIGKTMSTLFPYIKSFKENNDAKIFYLTAKTSGKENAHKAYKILLNNGLKAKSTLITAKEKMCLTKGKLCNPDDCKYAKGYYSKIGNIIRHSILCYDDFDYALINQIAKENEVCPFELQLDLSLYTDLIICDYNYMYDPISYMKRYFDEDSSHHLALIDEAHNLLDRSKDMYSSLIKESSLKLAKNSLKHIPNKKMKTHLAKISKVFSSYNGLYEEEYNNLEYIDDVDFKVFNNFLEAYLDVSKNTPKEVSKELSDFYLEVNRFFKIYDLKNDSFVLYIKKVNNEYEIHLSCLDASKFIRSISNRIKGSVYFSATLSPSDYYLDTLGGKKESDPYLKLESPFPKENFKVLIAPNVSIKYKNREKSLPEVDSYIDAFVSNKIGNYLVFFPSYEYLEKFRKIQTINPDINYYYQERIMGEFDKENFLNNFVPNPSKTNVGFAILGGSFSEGVDLVSDRLIGAVIVGIGMPKINFESDLIAEYYKNQELPGHDYAYTFPGMNKVMQAVGRVIRSEEDRGMVLLIDERYMIHKYRSLIKSEWSNYEVVLSKEDIINQVNNFYK